jgi:hypothetical protein
MDVNQISQKLLTLQHQINTLSFEVPAGYQVTFEIVDFSRAEDVVPRKRLSMSIKKVDQETVSIVLDKAKRLL